MIYENDNDRAWQTAAVKAVGEHLAGLPFMVGTDGEPRIRLVETVRSDLCSWDFDVYVHGLKYGCGEVKCRDYTKNFFFKNGWFMDSDRLNALFKRCYKKGFNVMLVLGTKEGFYGYVMMDRLLGILPDLERVDGIGADDHGSKPNDKSGVLIPYDALVWIPEDTR